MKQRAHYLAPGSCQVFFDFDNTVTSFDVLDDIIRRFSPSKEWIALEQAWEKGRIGSRECLNGQVRSLRVSRPRLLGYLSRVRVDPYFARLLELLKKHGIPAVIVSDSFSFFIRHILRSNGIRGIRVFANRVRFNHRHILPVFPRTDKECVLCAHCKRNTAFSQISNGSRIVCIGDGRSDICLAENADMVFAKGALLRHFQRLMKPCIPIQDLQDVYTFFQEAFDGSRRKGKQKNQVQRKR